MPDLPSDWRTCAADLFEHHYEGVLNRVARRNPAVDREHLNDAFVQAVLDIAAHPDKFHGDRQTTIADFLLGATQRALLPILRTHRRRRAREEKKAAAVARDTPAAREIVDELADGELANNARRVARNDEERSVLELWELGHSDAEIAQRLSRPIADVRRVRDRLTQRLRRIGQDDHDDDET
jgi:hypothetical protein